MVKYPRQARRRFPYTSNLGSVYSRGTQTFGRHSRLLHILPSVEGLCRLSESCEISCVYTFVGVSKKCIYVQYAWNQNVQAVYTHHLLKYESAKLTSRRRLFKMVYSKSCAENLVGLGNRASTSGACIVCFKYQIIS